MDIFSTVAYHIVMAPVDKEPELSKARTTFKNPFSLAARSTTSSKPAKDTRHAPNQSPAAHNKSSRRPVPSERADTTSNSATETAEAEVLTEEDGGMAQDSIPDLSVSQAPGTASRSSRRSRAKTSHIHRHITTRGENFVCNTCSRSYKTTGGTGAIARHLKKAHAIDSTASGPAEKRIRERTAIDAAILRGAEMSIKAEQKRKEEMMGIGLDKNTLEYLYLKWTLSSDIPLNNVRNTAFRTFLEYVNPVANRMLPNSESTMKLHAESLLGDGNKRLAEKGGRNVSRPALEDNSTP